MSDAALRQINGVVSKDGTDGPNINANLPLMEQLAGGKYYFGNCKQHSVYLKFQS